MSSKRKKKAQREEAIRREQERRYQQAESEAPFTREQFDALLDFLAVRISERGHDGSTAITREWLTMHGLPVEESLEFLRRHRLRDDYYIAIGCSFSIFGPTKDRLARMPLSESQLEALLDWLEEQVVVHGCDHSRRLTKQWLAEHSIPVAPAEFALLAQGGGCDCEVVMNVESEGIYP